jgi:hypothetical protein
MLNELKPEKKSWAEGKELAANNPVAKIHSGPKLHWGVKGNNDDDDDDDVLT